LALKIPQLLIQYLYKNRKMSLPGFGIFTLDKSVVLPEENDRTLSSLPNAVQFQNANIPTADKELITFICESTGKIKPLAIADLDSYLNLGSEMLNIGKPFYLEGIGTISKNKSGKFDFTPGEYSLIKDPTVSSDHHRKKTFHSDKASLNPPSPSQSRTILKLAAVLVALIIVGWGGYVMYKKTGVAVDRPSDTQSTQQVIPVTTDSSTAAQPARDTLKTVAASVPSANISSEPALYKWIILATEDKEHALKRYRQLISYDLKAFLYQKDSTYFKVYFQFPALANDTSRIKDSLKRQYAHSITIEY
jgi:hypothetical protein